MTFKPRTTAPSATDKNWIHFTDGGYNYCIEISGGSCLPNCVGYVWGRWREILGQSPKLSKGNANTFWSFKDGYDRTKYPRLGSVICWEGGQYGHVGVVEAYDQRDGTITVSMSAYGGERWYLWKGKPPYTYKERFHLQGFIHLPGSKPLPKAGTPMPTKISHMPSMYTMREPGATLKITPKASDGSKCTFSSSNTKVATVDKNGNIKAIGAGTATITVKAGSASRSFPVTVPKLKGWNEIVKPVYEAAVAQAKQMADFTYEWKGAAHQTIADSKKFGTCVTYANCVLYRLGILREKSFIYQDAKGHVTYNGATATLRKDCMARAHKYLVINQVSNIRPYNLRDKLRRGDILMYTRGTIKAGPGSHICIFTGKFDGQDAIVWDNNWARKKMKSEIHFNQPLDSYIRIRWFKIRTECDNGVISLSNNYLAAESVTVKYSGKTAIKSIVVDGKKIDPKKYPNSYTFKALKADHKIKVQFE